MTKSEPSQFLARLWASGLYSGFAPFASGTVGSFLCLAIWWAIFSQIGGPTITTQLVLSAICAITGLWAASTCLGPRVLSYDKSTKAQRDPSFIVIDEWAGMLISIVGIEAQHGLALIFSFFLFRAFDVIKPGPVRWVERASGAWGVMLDDIVAGAFTCLLMHLIVLNMISS